MSRTLAPGLVLLLVLGGCGPAADHAAAPLSTSAYWAIRDDGNAVTAAPWNRYGRGPDWQQGPVAMPPWAGPSPNPVAPPGWDPRWGRPIDSGIGNGQIPPGWGRGGRPWPWPTPLGTPVPAPAPSAYSQDLIREFQQLDANGDGVLSAQEYVEGKYGQIRYFRAPTEAEVAAAKRRLFAEFQQGDVNRDGRMTLDEFANNPVFHALGN